MAYNCVVKYLFDTTNWTVARRRQGDDGAFY